MRQRLSFRTVLLLLLSGVMAQGDEYFPTPEVLLENIAFWKKIYSEVSLREGLLHDREYPGVIYAKISVGERAGKARSSFIESYKTRTAESIRRITAEPESSWTEEDRSLKRLLERYVPEQDRAGAGERIRFQQGQRERFLEGLERSGAYLDTIRAILTRHGVPLRVAYLPHVESSFDPSAYSKVGAAGLWQFMRSTGKIYMTIDYTVDQRRDPFLATEAAAKFLRSNFNELGAWPLAITAYNHGTNGMRRAVVATGSRDLAVILREYQSKSFQFASRNFYGCFLAACEIAENPYQFFPSVKIRPRILVRDVAVDHYIDAHVIGTYLGISIEDLMSLNLALRPVVFQQNKQIPKGYLLRIPASLSGEDASKALAMIPDSLRSKEPERPRYYQVRRGDNLLAIASRLGVSPAQLAEENDITRSHRLRAGQVLRVPGAAPSPREVIAAATPPEPERVAIAPALKDGPRTVPAKTRVTRDTIRKVKPRPPMPVTPPDTLAEVLMAPALVIAEKTPASRTRLSSEFDADLYHLASEPLAAGVGAAIRVSVDETVGHYGEWLGAPTQRIRDFNRMGRHSSIRIGEKLHIPGTPELIETFIAARLEYHMAIEEDFFARYRVTEVTPQGIGKGQTLWDLLRSGDDEIPLWLLRKYNANLDFDRLVPGMVVWFPTIEEGAGPRARQPGGEGISRGSRHGTKQAVRILP